MASALDIAVSQLGKTDPTAYWSVVWPNKPADAVDWCACFVTYCFAEANNPLPLMNETAVTSGFVYCPDAMAWAQVNGTWSTTAAVGDVVLYCWDGSGTPEHTGIVQSVNADGSIVAIEGNTAPSASAPVGVYQMTRPPSVIVGFVRPPAPKEAPVEIIDVASFQHPNNAPIDWAAVKAAGIAGVVVKITEGLSYVNPFAAQDIAGAQAAGLLVAGYHFLHPALDPIAQANYYLQNGGQGLPGVALDCEVTDNVAQATIDTCMQQCHDYLALQANKTVVAYLNDTWDAATGIDTWGWYVWLADPSNTQPSHPCEMWQYGTSTVNGIQGTVDRDRWVGDTAVFASFFGNPAPSPVPVPTPPPAPAPTPTPAPPTPSSGVMLSSPPSTITFTTDGNGNAWVASPVASNQVVSVVPTNADPASIGAYIAVPQFAGVTSDNKLVFTGGIPNGNYSMYVWSVA